MQTKKLLILNILTILREETDAEHRLTQQEIITRLEARYGMTAGRKAVKRNLMDLVDYGVPIEYDVIERGNNPEVDPICTNWYYNHEITDAELRLLIDMVFSAKYIPGIQKNSLIEKLSEMSNKHFQKKVKYIPAFSETPSAGKQLFYSIDIIAEAIRDNRKVKFNYGTIKSDKKIYRKTDRNGNVISYQVSPYQTVAQNGRYFLIGNVDGHNNVAHFRIDRITDVKIAENEYRVPVESLPGFGNGLDIEKYMNEHINMLSGDSVRVNFRFSRKYTDTVMDWFGSSKIRLSESDDETVTATAVINERAMKYFAIQYSAFIEVTEPKELRLEIGKALSDAAEKYK